MKYLQAIGALLFVCMITFLAGKTNEASWETWEVYGHKEQQLTVYFLEMRSPNASCHVKVFDDGAIEAYGHDNTWPGKTFSSAIRLEKSEYGLKKTDYAFFATTETHENEPSTTRLEGYDVFHVKCLPHVGRLPETVREKLHGWLGIK